MATTSDTANMDVPISQIDIGYLIVAAEKIFNQEFYYISYMLLKEAEEILETLIKQGFTEYTEGLESDIRDLLSHMTEKVTVKDPDCYARKTTIGKLVLFYSEYKEMYQIDSLRNLIPKCDPELEGEYETREYILKTSKALRTALKMLSRVARGNTPEEVFIRENEIPEEFLQDTEYDEKGSSETYRLPAEFLQDTEYDEEGSSETYKLPAEANMDVPISIIDIGYIIDAAETFFIQDFYYISYILLKEAEKILETLKEQGSTVYTEGLESNIRDLLSLMTENGTIKGPDRYAGKTTIGKLVLFYSEYKEMYRIDSLLEEEKKHKKWGILSANYQEAEGRTMWRETLLTTAKALRTALKALSLTSQELIQEEFLQDTEYDKGDSSETYNIIPFDGPTDWLPDEVNEAIASLKCGIEATPSPTREHDDLDCLQKFFGFQESSVSNQRENIVNLLSNEQMRLGKHGTTFEDALEKVFLKTLDNYIKWCSYLRIEPIWNNTDENANREDENVISKEKKKILYISLYYLIWGEAANVRFLPECLCYIFHHMSKQLDDEYFILVCEQLNVPYVSGSFIDQVIQPLYEVIAAEAKIKKDSDVPHSEWRNYDDFNEYFWSRDCFDQLSWPLNKDSPFFQKPSEGSTVYGKTSFVECRTFLHLYHSFHRMWIFHVIMFEALVIIALNDEKLNFLRQILIVGPTYFFMKLIQSMLDIVLKDGDYSKTSRVDVLRIRFRIICFMSTLSIFFIGIFRKYLQEKTSSVEESIVFNACIVVLVIYACMIKWINQLEKWVVRRMDERLLDSYLEEEYVGRHMGEKYIDIFWYTIFWIVTLAINFALTYYGLIKYLVRPTRDITDVSKSIHNMLAIGSLWVGVICAYIVGSHVSYNVTSAVVGTYIVGRMDGIGKIKSLGDVRKCFGDIPKKIMDRLNREPENNLEDVNLISKGFSHFWNHIVMHLREEDNISDLEQYALSMPEQSEFIDVIQWPLFLLVGKVSLAIKIAAKGVPQEVMWDEIKSDVYMKHYYKNWFYPLPNPWENQCETAVIHRFHTDSFRV